MTKSKFDWKTVGTVVALILGAGWLYLRMADTATKMKAMEDAIRIIAHGQSPEVEKLVDDVLKIAQVRASEGRTENAQNLVDDANALLAKQVKNGEGAPESLFAQTLPKYRTLLTSTDHAGVNTAAFNGILQLATLRSQSTPQPAYTNTLTIGSMGYGPNGEFQIKDSVIDGPSVLRTTPEGFVIDGIVFDNVVVKNTTVIYKGGPLHLHKVVFVNCQFNVPFTPRAPLFLEAIITHPDNVTVS